MIDFSTIFGLVAGITLLTIGIMITPGADMMLFVSPASAMITIGGSICAVFVTFPIGDLKSAKNKAWWVDYLLIRGAFGAIEAELEANGQVALWPRYRKMLPALAASMVKWQVKQSAPLSEPSSP